MRVRKKLYNMEGVMSVIEIPKQATFWGYSKQKTAFENISHHARDRSHIILLHGPPGVGKTELSFYMRSMIRPGQLFFVSCNSEVNKSTLPETMGYLQNLIENPLSESTAIYIFFDEVDVIGLKRKRETLAGIPGVQSVMAVTSAIKQRRGLIVLATNTPSLLDWGIATRCDDVIYLPLPGVEEITDAFLYIGYSMNKAKSIAREWVAEMEAKGWWTGRQIFPVIMNYGDEVRKLNDLDIITNLNDYCSGARIDDPTSYERENQVWIDAAKRTLHRWSRIDNSAPFEKKCLREKWAIND